MTEINSLLAEIAPEDIAEVHGEFMLSGRAPFTRATDFQLVVRTYQLVHQAERTTLVKPLHPVLVEIIETDTSIRVFIQIVELIEPANDLGLEEVIVGIPLVEAIVVDGGASFDWEEDLIGGVGAGAVLESGTKTTLQEADRTRWS